MQNGQTARVRCETAPMNGTFTKDSAAGLNHLKDSTTQVNYSYFQEERSQVAWKSSRSDVKQKYKTPKQLP